MLQGPGATILLHGAPLVDVIADGFMHWMRGYGRFVTFWPRLSMMERVSYAGGFLLWLAIAIAGVRQAWRQRDNRESSVILLAALALLLMPGIVQAPTTRADVLVLGPTDSPWLAVFFSRFYYLSLCGLSLLLANLAALRWDKSVQHAQPGMRTLTAIASVLVMLPMALGAPACANTRRIRAGQGLAMRR